MNFYFCNLNDVKKDCGCFILKCNNFMKEKEKIEDRENKEDEMELKLVDFKSINFMVLIRGGKFIMGIDKLFLLMDGEGFVREVRVSLFYMDIYEVSNAEFELFVNSIGYVIEVWKIRLFVV